MVGGVQCGISDAHRNLRYLAGTADLRPVFIDGCWPAKTDSINVAAAGRSLREWT
jgi:hypothetical protein